MLSQFKNRDFLKLSDFSKSEVEDLIQLAIALKQAKGMASEKPLLQGKNIALIFEKTSTRTRCAFEVAAHDQGAHVTYLESQSSQMGHKESIKDTARVLSGMFDAIEYRGSSQALIEELALYSKVPVLNGLTDQWHPTQMLADLMTMREYSQKKYTDISFVYLGDARNNTGNSLLHLGALMGMDVRIAGPKSLWPEECLVLMCKELAKTSGARILLTESTEEAVKNVDFIYTDVWVSMGESDEVWSERIALLEPYRVDSELMKLSDNVNVKFMHCLPAYHDRETKIGEAIYQAFGLDGVEVTNQVFESEQSIVFSQAENRMHTIKALLVALLG
ncbi:MAG: ornithine carbamoyltransferase [Neisseriaceae bacterium]|nr:MAG: ornithine carbamoyltransferase [Neisseriaceae bacterium]